MLRLIFLISIATAAGPDSSENPRAPGCDFSKVRGSKLDSTIHDALLEFVPYLDSGRFKDLASRATPRALPHSLAQSLARNEGANDDTEERKTGERLYSLLTAAKTEMDLTDRQIFDLTLYLTPKILQHVPEPVSVYESRNKEGPVGHIERGMFGSKGSAAYLRQQFGYIRQEPIGDKPSRQQAKFLEALVAYLFEKVLAGREYQQRYWVRSLLVSTPDMDQAEAARITKWIDAEVLRQIKRDFPGEEGMLLFAEKYHRGQFFSARVYARSYIANDTLNDLNWRFLPHPTTVELWREVKKRVSPWGKFVQDNRFGGGLRRLADELFDGNVRFARRLIKRAVGKEKLKQLGWNEKDALRAEYLGMGKELPIAFRGFEGRELMVRNAALDAVREEFPDFPSRAAYRTPVQERAFDQARKKASSRINQIFTTEEKVRFGWKSPSPPSREDFLINYSGFEGQIAFGEYFGTNPKKAMELAMKHYDLPMGVLKHNGWATFFGSSKEGRAIRSRLLDPMGRPFPRYAGYNGFFRYQRDFEMGEHSAKVNVGAVLGEKVRSEILRWVYPQAPLSVAKAPIAYEIILAAERKGSRPWYLWTPEEQARYLPPAYASSAAEALDHVRLVRQRLLDSDGRIRPAYNSADKMDAYSIVFPGGTIQSLEQVVEAAIYPMSLSDTPWTFNPRSPIDRPARYNEGWVALTGEDGRLDPFYKNPSAILTFLQYFRPNETAASAAEYARSYLSPKEFSELGWEKVPLSKKVGQHSNPLSEWSPMQRKAALAYLGFVLDHAREPKGGDGSDDEVRLGFLTEQIFGQGMHGAGEDLRDTAIFPSEPDARSAIQQLADFYQLDVNVGRL